jgi:arylsulfatase A-like enzyme
MADSRTTSGSRTALLLIATVASACSRTASGPEEPKAIRLVDAFDAKQVEGTPGKPAAPPPRIEWRFDGAPPRPASPAPGPAASPPAFVATRGWEAGPGVSGLAVRNGLLVGRTTTDFPVIRIERTAGLDNADQLQALEVRMRVSGGANVSAVTRPAAGDIKLEPALAGRVPWPITAPVMAAGQMQTYTITPAAPVSGSRIRYLLIRPTDAAGADFAIESVRLVFRREQLAGIPSGVGWQGLRDIFRETLVTRSPETVRFPVTLPSRPVLDLAIGTPQDDPVSFRVSVRRADGDTPIMTATVTTPHRWERREIDLAPFAGQSVSLVLAANADKPGALAFWGAPTVRQRVGGDAATAGAPAQGVILVQLDTLRKDHLDAYGYERPTAPVLRGLAGEGTVFQNAISQTSWTKVETPSVLTSLYPTTHGVYQIPDRLPASATTIAEVFRQGGYATLSYSSVVFTGQFTNLHQGFEELHEGESTAGRAGPRGAKTAREYVDRLVDWLGDHRDVPFFVYLHFFDPHPPYEPNRPYDTTWADPKGREEYLRQQEALKKTVGDAFMAQRGMATPEELRKAGIDPAAYIRYSEDWYDGSIRAMDVEIGRLVERLRELGLGERSVIAFFADHGEEFHEHGRMWHGQSIYGELIRVPLILWGPGRVAKGLNVDEPVELVDVMPTLLDLSGLAAPPAAQGQSLRPLLAKPQAGGGWKHRPPVAERQPMGGNDFPNAAESYAIMDGNWKLIHNVVRPPEKPEFELFDFYQDPLDRTNVAAQHADIVGRLAKSLDSWHQMAKAAKLKPDSELTKGMSREQLEQLRSLGYVK